MRLPRVRFTIRWLMVAVAIAGVALGAVAMKRRRDRFRDRARYYAEKQEAISWLAELEATSAALTRSDAKRIRGLTALNGLLRAVVEPDRDGQAGGAAGGAGKDTYDEDAARAEAEAAGDRARAAWYAGMRRKYERAARYPWLPVEPDPPEPE